MKDRKAELFKRVVTDYYQEALDRFQEHFQSTLVGAAKELLQHDGQGYRDFAELRVRDCIAEFQDKLYQVQNLLIDRAQRNDASQLATNCGQTFDKIEDLVTPWLSAKFVAATPPDATVRAELRDITIQVAQLSTALIQEAAIFELALY